MGQSSSRTQAPTAPTIELNPTNLFSTTPSIVRKELDTASQTLALGEFNNYINTFYTAPILPSVAFVREMTPLGFHVFNGFIDDEQPIKDSRFQIVQMYIQTPGINVNKTRHILVTRTLLSAAIARQHEHYIEDRIIELLLNHPNTDLITSSPITCAMMLSNRHYEPPYTHHEYFPVEHDLHIIKLIVNACKLRSPETLIACVNQLGTRSQVSPLFTAANHVLISQRNGISNDVVVYTEIVDLLIENGARIRDGSNPEDFEAGEYMFTLPLMHGDPFAMTKEEFGAILMFVESRKKLIQEKKQLIITQSLPNNLPENIRRRISKFTVGGSRFRKTRRKTKPKRG